MNLRIGLSALQASQYAINNVSQNLANANTEGYHRQDVVLETSQSTLVRGRYVGSGVEVGDVRRYRDLIVESAYTTATADLSRVEQNLQIESRIESLIAPGDGSIQNALTGLFDEFSRLSANPGERTLRNSILNQANNLVDRIRDVSGDLVQIKQDLRQQIELEVESLNSDLEDLVDLQNRIRSSVAGDAPNSLLDQRDQLVNQIAERVDVQRYEFVQEQLGLAIAGSTISIGAAPIRFEAVTDAAGIVQIQIEDGNRPTQFNGGRLAGLLDANNNLIEDYSLQVDTLAQDLIHRFDQLHAIGIGIDGAFETLQATREVSDVDLPLSESAAFPIEAGELFVTLTSPSGELRTQSITVDPETDSLQGLATKISGLDNVQALVDSSTGRLTMIAEPGYQFDFSGRLETVPDLASFTGTSVPRISGDYLGTENQNYQITALGTGIIGKTADLTMRVTDGSGNILKEFNVGDGYEAGSEIDLGDGVTVQFDVGDINTGDSFELVMVSDPDTTGTLSALGLNNFFSGTDATNIGIDRRIQESPDSIATSRSGEIADTRNLEKLIGLRDQPTMRDGRFTFEGFLAEVNSEIGFRVQSSQSVQVTLSELQFEYETERNSTSGVDVNEELINLTTHQKTYEAAVQVVRTMEAMLDELFQIIR